MRPPAAGTPSVKHLYVENPASDALVPKGPRLYIIEEITRFTANARWNLASPPTPTKGSESMQSNEAGNVALRVEALCKDYVLKGETVQALRGVTFEVQDGEYMAIMGPSGSGKSTLLNLLGCLDRPTGGEYHLGDQNVAELNDDQLSHVRASKIGFVFQSYNLISQLTVLENIEVPLHYQGKISPDTRQLCAEFADMVGLADRLNHRPSELSGGQQQRVAIARSLVNDPFFILADEATGNLDSKTTDEILSLFDKLNDGGKTIIMITHEDEVASRTKRTLKLRDGQIESDQRSRDVSARSVPKSKDANPGANSSLST